MSLNLVWVYLGCSFGQGLSPLNHTPFNSAASEVCSWKKSGRDEAAVAAKNAGAGEKKDEQVGKRHNRVL